ncbi:hypothetical protein MHW47_10830 [Streptomyces sp. OfavH-34-F]|uniref:hypothetical protein n=1 Tax=Streptomyces sp. OfavH-34-F TaxID=2917760 RepID=UPI001EF334D6|nr:hypothetical protein [Streptomyces sp. OfavH-34-F]MCG7524928.1 hypothetical protein [Streptomyces sp. OfavH-34-F]
MFRVRPSTDRLAQDAYEAYAKSTDNKNVRGDELPAWGELGTPVQNGWRLAAEAVRHRLEM